MSDTLKRSSIDRPRGLLTRLIEDPDLVTAVRHLEPTLLGRVIRHVGLEDAGELVAMLSTDQLEHIFDTDLWTSDQPGADETFDADRFAVWLEVMLEAGVDIVAQKLTELPEELILLALCRHVLVIDLDEMALEMSGGGVEVDLTEKALDSCLYQEFDEYQVIAKRHDGWDAIVAVLAEMNESHYDVLRRLLERCCDISTEVIEDNGGLYNVLTSDEMLETDVAAERESRRAGLGFIAPSAGGAFLKLAETTDLDLLVGSDERDPVARMYFRRLDRRPATSRSAKAKARRSKRAARARKRLFSALRDEGVIEGAAPLLIGGGDESGQDAGDTQIRRALALLQTSDPELYDRRVEELTFLANVLVAGGSIENRRFRPLEAAETVLDACQLGLERLAEPGPIDDERAAELLSRATADKLFRIGWHVRQHQ